MSDDFINGAFQAVAALMIMNNVRVLNRDREVRGVSIMSTTFFFLYGVWNLRYYPALDQWWSFAGGVLVMLANCACVGMMIYYTYFFRRPAPDLTLSQTSPSLVSSQS